MAVQQKVLIALVLVALGANGMDVEGDSTVYLQELGRQLDWLQTEVLSVNRNLKNNPALSGLMQKASTMVEQTIPEAVAQKRGQFPLGNVPDAVKKRIKIVLRKNAEATKCRDGVTERANSLSDSMKGVLARCESEQKNMLQITSEKAKKNADKRMNGLHEQLAKIKRGAAQLNSELTELDAKVEELAKYRGEWL